MLYSQWFVLQQLTLPLSLGFHSGCFNAIGRWPPSGICFDAQCFMVVRHADALPQWTSSSLGDALPSLLLDARLSSLVGFSVTRALSI
jgi:hypothetical protein